MYRSSYERLSEKTSRIQNVTEATKGQRKIYPGKLKLSYFYDLNISMFARSKLIIMKTPLPRTGLKHCKRFIHAAHALHKPLLF